MDLEKLERLLAPLCPKDRIKKVFQFGSQVWGSNSAKSDWDFFVVIENYTGVVHPDLDLSLVDYEVDISAYSEERWQELLFAHDMLVLVCEYLPPQFIWKNTYKASTEISLKTLVRGVSKEMSTCLSLSNVHFVKNGDKRTGIKNFVHATRYLHFGTQLATQGRLYDLGASNETLKEALQTLADHPMEDYNFFSQIYKPIITQRTKDFQFMVQGMIEKEMEVVDKEILHYGAERALLSFLGKCSEPLAGLSNLYRIFSVSSVLKSETDGVFTYLLTSTSDAPEGHPITTACGAALVQVSKNQGWRFLARSYGSITYSSLNSNSIISNLHLAADGEYKAFVWPTGAVLIVLWYNSIVEAWSACCTHHSAESQQLEASFLQSFEVSGLSHLQDTSIASTWLYNRDPLHPILRVFCASKHKSLDLEVDNPADSILNHARLDSKTYSNFESISDLSVFGWPPVEFESPLSEDSIRLRLSELEAFPFDYNGLFFPHFFRGTFVESRSRQARLILTLPEEQRRDTYQINQNPKHVALAFACARREHYNDLLAGLNEFTTLAVLSEIKSYKAVENNVKFFWSIVKAHAGDAATFARTMNGLKIWKRVGTILQSIRLHSSQDPMILLHSSPVALFVHWKSIFATDEILNLVQNVTSQLASIATSTKPPPVSK